MIATNRRFFRYYTYIQPALKSPVVKTYGQLIFTLIALIVFILFAIKPTVETILTLQKQLETAKDTLGKISQKSKDLTLAKTNYDSLDQSVINTISTSLPTQPELKSLIQSLEQVALVNQATISAIQIDSVTLDSVSHISVEPALIELGFTYNIEGSYEGLTQILNQLKNNQRVISINNVTFNTSSEDVLFMTILGKAYYLK